MPEYTKQLTTRSGHTFNLIADVPIPEAATKMLLEARKTRLNRVARFSSNTQVGKMPKRRAKGGVCADTLTPQS